MAGASAAASAGDIQGGDAGPATSGGDNSFTFGNINSGGSGGFNPFATSTASQIANPQNLIILGVALVGVAWVMKKK